METHRPIDGAGWSNETPNPTLLTFGAPKALLGLPCSSCLAYYEAERAACPICGCTERVSPIQASPPMSQKSRAA
ncbi:MAG TPA: hypothetical protein VH744_02585 [Terriglobales bacterium]|jgi:hypothetical protein